jgi:hypothetical protein
MFGSGRVERDGSNLVKLGTAGFAELGRLDSNADGMISALDAEFATLRVWVDANGDAQTDAGELKTLAELGLVSIFKPSSSQSPLLASAPARRKFAPERDCLSSFEHRPRPARCRNGKRRIPNWGAPRPCQKLLLNSVA